MFCYAIYIMVHKDDFAKVFLDLQQQQPSLISLNEVGYMDQITP